MIVNVIHGEGFDIPLEIFTRTYDQNRYVIADCFQAVFEIEEITSLDPDKLRWVYSSIETVIDILREYTMDQEYYYLEFSSLTIAALKLMALHISSVFH